MNEWMNEWMNQWINQSINQSISQSVSQSINQSINQSSKSFLDTFSVHFWYIFGTCSGTSSGHFWTRFQTMFVTSFVHFQEIVCPSLYCPFIPVSRYWNTHSDLSRAAPNCIFPGKHKKIHPGKVIVIFSRGGLPPPRTTCKRAPRARAPVENHRKPVA